MLRGHHNGLQVSLHIDYNRAHTTSKEGIQTIVSITTAPPSRGQSSFGAGEAARWRRTVTAVMLMPGDAALTADTVVVQHGLPSAKADRDGELAAPLGVACCASHCSAATAAAVMRQPGDVTRTSGWVGDGGSCAPAVGKDPALTALAAGLTPLLAASCSRRPSLACCTAW